MMNADPIPASPSLEEEARALLAMQVDDLACWSEAEQERAGKLLSALLDERASLHADLVTLRAEREQVRKENQELLARVDMKADAGR